MITIKANVNISLLILVNKYVGYPTFITKYVFEILGISQGTEILDIPGTIFPNIPGMSQGNINWK